MHDLRSAWSSSCERENDAPSSAKCRRRRAATTDAYRLHSTNAISLPSAPRSVLISVGSKIAESGVSVAFPGAGWAVFQQGHRVLHRTTRLEELAERITAVASRTRPHRSPARSSRHGVVTDRTKSARTSTSGTDAAARARSRSGCFPARDALELRADCVHDPNPFIAQEAERARDGDGQERGGPRRVWTELIQQEHLARVRRARDSRDPKERRFSIGA
jgi:hypothetical protein